MLDREQMENWDEPTHDVAGPSPTACHHRSPDMKEQIRIWWALASNLERFLLIILPFTTTWDLYRGNWLDLIVGTVVGSWILYDLIERDV